MFIKEENEQNPSFISDQSGFNSRRENNYFMRRQVPPGWERFYLDPPIQLVGIPVQVQNGDSMELDVQHIHFYTLSPIEKLHYCLGLGYYTFRLTSIFLFRSTWFILSNTAMLVRWTLGGAFGWLGNFLMRISNDHQNNLSHEDSSEDNIDELVERQIANYELMVR